MRAINTLAFWLIGAVGSTAALPAAEPSGVRHSDEDIELSLRGTVVYKDRRRIPPFTRARWSRTPDQDVLNRAYREIPGGVYGALHCDLAVDWSLTNCRMTEMDDPPDPRAAQIIMSLAREFRLEANSVEHAEIDAVWLSLWLRGQYDSRICPTLFCVLHTMQPPPPPPPPVNPAPPQRSTHTEMRAQILFRDGTRAPFHWERWEASPPAERLRSAYESGRISGGGYGVLTCDVGADRYLESCRLDAVNPTGRGFEAVLLQMGEGYRLAADTPLDRIDRVMIGLRLRQDRGDAPCGPPFCGLSGPPWSARD